MTLPSSLRDDPAPAASPDGQELLLRRLAEISCHSPHLAGIARLYSAILPLLREAELGMGPVHLPAETARENLARGQYLLQDMEIELDVPAIAGLMARLAEAAEKTGEKIDMIAFRRWMESHEEGIGELLQKVLEGGKDILRDATGPGMDAGLLMALVQNALKPDLRALCRQLAPLAAGIPWNRGTCFVCGSLPVLGELQGNAQALHLRCGVCGADWEYPRLACVHCGRDDYRDRDYLFSEGPLEKEHIEACRSCGNYIKIVPSFSPTPVELLPIEDLATVHLDEAARERGYGRPGDAG